MNYLNDTRIAAALADVQQRAMNVGEAYEWATGRLSFTPLKLLPSAQSGQERQALERLARMVTSLGPRAMTVLKNGTLGDINWGTGGEAVDKAMRELRLTQLATRFHMQARVTGVIAGHVYTPEGGKPRIQRLGGYIEPLRDPDDVDYEWGLYQAILVKLTRGREHWLVRIYDLEQSLIYEWPDLYHPGHIGRIPDPLPGAHKLPRYRILGEDADGVPLGEFMTALPILKSEWASQLRADRVEEATGFGQMLIKGEAQGYESRSSTRVILTDKDGDAKYLTPGDLTQIHTHHDRKLERLRQMLNLPGGYLGGQTPSGEALVEASQDYMSSCDVVATSLGEVLTELVADFFEVSGISGPPSVSVSVNRSRVKDQVMTQVDNLVSKGLLDRAVGIRILSQFFDEWSDKDVEAFIASSAPQGVAP